jgi:hypothetical protein
MSRHLEQRGAFTLAMVTAIAIVAIGFLIAHLLIEPRKRVTSWGDRDREFHAWISRQNPAMRMERRGTGE